MGNLPQQKPKLKPARPVELCCDLCRLPRTRRRALVAEVNGSSLFLCEICCRKAGSNNPYGLSGSWLLYASIKGGDA